MRLLITVVCCLIVIHGSSSVPGFRRKQAKRLFLAQALGQGISLKNQVVKDVNGPIADNEEKQQSPVTNINIHNIIHNNDNNILQKHTGIGNYNSNVIKNKLNANENLNKNTDYSVLSLGTSNNGIIEDSLNSGSGIKEVVQSRSKREVAKPTVKTYRYESQPGRSRFSYIQKIQKLFEPKHVATPKILTKHKTIVVENHTAHEEHHSEEIHEHHTTTTSQLKLIKKKRKSKRIPGSPGTIDDAEDYEYDESTEEESAETDGLAIKNESSNVLGEESKQKNSRLKSTRVVQPNVSVVAIRNGTQNSLEKKKNETKKHKIMVDNKPVSEQTITILGKKVNTSETVSESKDSRFVGITEVKTEKLDGTPRSSNMDLVYKDKGTAVDSPTSLKMQTVMNSLKSNTQYENLPDFSTLPAQNDKQLSRQSVPPAGKNLKSVLKNVFGLRGNSSPVRTIAEVGNSPSVFRESLSARNISTVINNLIDHKENNNNNKINNREPFFNVPNAAKTLTTFVKPQITAPSKPPRAKLTKFIIPKNKSASPSMGLFYNIGLTQSEEENTEINHNIEIENRETVLKVPKVIGNQPSIPNKVSADVPNVQKSITTTINRPVVQSSEPPVVGASPNEEGNSPAVPRSPRIISSQPDVGFSHPSANVFPIPKSTITIQNSPSAPSTKPSQTKVSKFRRPKIKTITTAKEVLYDTDALDWEEENTEINTNDEIDKKNNVTTVLENLPSVSIVPSVLANVSSASKSTRIIQNSPTVPSSQPSARTSPKFRRPKSKIITTSKKILNDTDFTDSEEDNTEINNNVQIDSENSIVKVPKVLGNFPSIPIVSNMSASIPTVPKSTPTTQNSQSVPSSQPLKKRVPKFRRPKSKTVASSTEGLPNESANNPNVLKPITTIQNSQSIPSSQLSKTRFPKFRRPKSKAITSSTVGLPNVSENNPQILKPTKTIQNSLSVPSSQPSKTGFSIFRIPKSKTFMTTKEMHDTDAIDSEENTETNIFEIDKKKVFKIPNVQWNLPSVPIVPLNVPKSTTTTTTRPVVAALEPSLITESKVEGDIPIGSKVEGKVTAVPRSPRVITEQPDLASSQPSLTRIPKFRKPKSKTITTSNEIYETDIIDSEEDNTEINNVEIDNKNTVVKGPNVLRNKSSVPSLPYVPASVPSTSKSTNTIQNSPNVPSSQPTKIRFPKFRIPKSRTITTSKEVLYDTDIIDSEEDNIEINKLEIDNQNVIKVPNVLGNLPSVPIVPNKPKNVPTFSKSIITTTTRPVGAPLELSVIRESNIERDIPIGSKVEGKVTAVPRPPRVITEQPDLASSQPSLTRIPKFRKPKSKTITTSNEIYETDIIDSEEDNTEINNVEIDNKNTVVKGPNVLRNKSSVPSLPYVPASVPSTSKSTNTIQNSPNVPSSQPTKIRFPKFRIPKGRTITTSKEVLYDTDVTDSEEDNTETNTVEIDNQNIIKVPNVLGNLPSVPIVPKKPENVPAVSKSIITTTTRPVGTPLEPSVIRESKVGDIPIGSKVGGKVTAVPRSPRVITEQPDLASSQPSLTRIPKFRKPKSKTITTSKKIYETNIIDSEEDNTEINIVGIDNKNIVIKGSNVLRNKSSIPSLPYVPASVPSASKSKKTIQSSPNVPSSQPSKIRIPKFRIPKSSTITTSKEVLYDIDVTDSEEDNNEINTVEIDNQNIIKVPNVLGNLPSVPIVPKKPENVPAVSKSIITTTTRPVGTPLEPSVIRESKVGDIPIGSKVGGKVTAVPRSPRVITEQPDLASSQPSLTRIPKFRKPKSKTITTSKKIYETNIIDSEEDNTEINIVGIDNKNIVIKGSNVLRNKSSIPSLPYVPASVPSASKSKKTIQSSPNVPSSQPSKIRIPKFRIPKSSTITTSKEVLYDIDVTDSEEDNNEINTAEIDNKNKVVNVKNPEVHENLQSAPIVPNVPLNVNNVPKSTKTIQNSSSVPFSQPSVIRVSKFRRPKIKTITTSKAIYADAIDSEEDNTEINKLEIDNQNITKVPNVLGNLPSVPIVPNKPENVPTVSKSTITTTTRTVGAPLEPSVIRESKVVGDILIGSKLEGKDTAVPRSSGIITEKPDLASSQPSLTRIPKFRKPKSKTITTSNEIYETDIIDSEEDNTEINNVEIDNKNTVVKGPNVLRNKSSVPSLPYVPASVPSTSKSTNTIQNSPNVPSSQPTKIRFPKFRIPKSRTITTSKEVLYDTDIIDSEEDNTEINKLEIDNQNVIKVPNVLGNLPSVPIVPKKPENVPTVSKSITTTTRPVGAPLEPSVIRESKVVGDTPIGSMLEGKDTAVPRSPRVITDQPDVAPSQSSLTKVSKFRKPKNKDDSTSPEISNDDSDFSTEIYIPENKKRIVTTPQDVEVVGNIPTVLKPGGEVPAVSSTPKIIANQPDLAPPQPSLTSVPKYWRPKNKAGSTFPEIADDNDDRNTEIHSPDNKERIVSTVQKPNVIGNIPTAPKLTNVIRNNPSPPRSELIAIPPGVGPSELPLAGITKFMRPKNKAIPTSKEVYDEDFIDLENEISEINHNIELDNTETVFKVPKVLGNFSPVPVVPNLFEKYPSIPKEPKTIVDLPSLPFAPKVVGNLPAIPRSPATTGNRPVISSEPLNTELGKPKYKEISGSTGKSSDTDGIDNSETYNTVVGNLSSERNIPNLSKYVPDFLRSLTNFGNRPVTPNLKTSMTQTMPKIRPDSTSLDMVNDNLEKYSPEVNDDTNKYLNQPKPIGNLHSIPKVPVPEDNLPHVISSPTTFGNWPFFAPSQTIPIRTPKLKRPKTKAVVPASMLESNEIDEPTSEEDNTKLYNEIDNNTESDFKLIKNLSTIPNTPKAGGNLPAIPRSPKAFENEPVNAPSQPSVTKIPKLQKSKTKAVPTSMVGSNETDESTREEDNTKIYNEIDNNTESDFKVIKNLSTISNAPQAGGNLPAIPRSPKTFENEPVNAPSQPSVTKIPKLQKSKTKAVPTLTESERYSPEAYDNTNTYFNIPDTLGNHPSYPKLLAVADNLPYDARSPAIFGNWPFFTPSQTSPIRTPKLKRPKTKAVSTSMVETDESTPEEDNTKIYNDIDNYPESDFKIIKNLSTISNVPKAGGNLSAIPRSPKTFENESANASSQPSVTKIPKLQKSKTKAVPTLMVESNETHEPTSEEDNTKIYNEIDNNTESDFKVIKNLSTIPNAPQAGGNLPAIPRSPKTFENEPVNAPSQPSVTKIPKLQKSKTKAVPTLTESERYSPEAYDNTNTYFNIPDTLGNHPSYPKLLAVADNLPYDARSPAIFGNWPFFTPSQTSPIRTPKLKRPKTKAISTSMVETDESTPEEDNTKIYNDIDNYPESDFMIIKNLSTISNVPKAGGNLSAIPRSPKIFENESANASSQPSVTKIPKLQKSKTKAVPTLMVESNETHEPTSEEDNTKIYNEIDNTETDFKVSKAIKNLSTFPKLPNVVENLPAIPRSPKTFENEPLNAPSQSPVTKIPKLQKPETKAIPTSTESERYSPEANDNTNTYFNIPDRLGNQPSFPKLPTVADNLPDVIRSLTSFGNWPFFAPSQTSPIRTQKLKRPKTKAVPTSMVESNETDEPTSEEDNTNIFNEIDNNPESDFKVIKNLSTIPNVPKAGGNLSAIPRSPKTFENEPDNAPSQPSVTKIPKLQKSKTKAVPTSMVESNETDESTREEDNTKIYNEIDNNTESDFKVIKNLSTIPNAPQAGGNLPAIPRSPKTFENEPVNAPSQPSVTKIPKLQKSKTKAVPTSTESERYSPEAYDNTNTFFNIPDTLRNQPSYPKLLAVADKLPYDARSPAIFGNWPFFDTSQTSPIRTPKLKRPKTKAVSTSMVESNETDEPTSEENNTKIFNEIDNNPESDFKVIKNLSTIPNAPQAGGNLPAIPRSPKTFENEPVNAPSQPSVTKIPKLQKSKTKAVPTSIVESNETDEPTSEEDDTQIYNEIDNTETDFKIIKNLSTIPNVPKAGGNLSAIPRSPKTFENESANASSQPSVTKIPKLQKSKTKAVPTSMVESNETDEPTSEEDNTKIYNEIDNTETDFKVSKVIENLSTLPKLPNVFENLPAIPRSPKTFENEPLNAPSQSPVTKIPKLQKPETKAIPTSTESERYSPEANDNTNTYFNIPDRLGNQPSFPKLPTVADNLPDVIRSLTSFGNWPFFAPSQTSPIRTPKLKRPKTKAFPTSMVESNETDESALEKETELKVPNVIKKLSTIPNIPKVFGNLPATPRSPRTSENEPLSTLSQQAVTKNPKLQKPNTKALTYNDPDELNLVQDKTSVIPVINNQNEIDNLNVPKVLEGLPAIPRSPKSSENEPVNSPSQPSLKKTFMPQKQKIKSFPTIMESERYSPKLNYNPDNFFDQPKPIGNVHSIPKVPAPEDNLPHVISSPTTFGNWPFFDPSQTSPARISKLKRPKTKTVPTSMMGSNETDESTPEEDNTKIYNEIDNNTESDFKVIKNLSTIPNALKAGGNVPAIPRSPKTFENEPVNAPSQPSVTKIPKLQKSKTKAVPTSTESERYSPEAYDNTNTYFNIPDTLGNQPSYPKLLAVADNLPYDARSPAIFGNWPFFTPSQTSPIRTPKLKRPKTKAVSTSMVETDESTPEEDNTKIYNDIDNYPESDFKVIKNLSTIPNAPKSVEHLPAIPRSPRTSENVLANAPSQPSATNILKLQKPKTKTVPTSMVEFNETDESTPEKETEFKVPKVIKKLSNIPNIPNVFGNLPATPRSPRTSENEPLLTLSQQAVTKNPKLQKPNTKTLPYNDPDELNPVEDKRLINNQNEIDNPDVPKVLENLPAIPRSPKTFENGPSNPTSQPSLTKIPTSLERYNPKFNYNTIFSNPPNSAGNFPSFNLGPREPENISAVPGTPKTKAKRPVNSSSQPSLTRFPKLKRPKSEFSQLSPEIFSDYHNFNADICVPEVQDGTEAFFNPPQIGGNLHSVPKIPPATFNLPEVTKSPITFGNLPFFPLSQKYPTRFPKLKRPKSKTVPSSQGIVNNSEELNSEKYNLGVNDDTETFFNLPQSGKTSAIIRSPATQGNWPTIAPLQPSKTKVPKFRRPISKVVLSYPEIFTEYENLNTDRHSPEVHDSTETFIKLPKIGGNLATVPKIPAAAVTKSPTIFENWPFFASSNTSPDRLPKLRRPKSSLAPLYPESFPNNENSNVNRYSLENHDGTEKLFNQPEIGENFPSVPKVLAVADSPHFTGSPTTFGNGPIFAPSETFAARVPKLRRPNSKAFPSLQDIVYNNENLHVESYIPDVNNEIKRFFNIPQSEITSGVSTSPAIKGNRPVIAPSKSSVTRVPKLGRPKFNDVSSFPKVIYDDEPNEERHSPEVDDDVDNLFNLPKFERNLPLLSKVSKVTGSIQYVSRRPTPFGNWPVIASPQTSTAIFPKLRRPKIMSVTPSTGVYYAGTPISEIHDTTNFFKVPQKVGRFLPGPKSPVVKGNLRNVPKLPLTMYNQPLLASSPSRLAKVPKLHKITNGVVPISKVFPYGKVVPNYKLYNKNIVSNVPLVIGHVQVPQVPTPLYIPHALNIPKILGNHIPAPKVSLIGSRRKVPMIIENHPHLVVASPAYTAMKFPTVTKSKNWVVPSASEISYGSDAIYSKPYNTFLRNISPVPKVSIVRKSQMLPISPAPMINLPQARSGLSKNRFFLSSKTNAGILDMEKFNTGLTNTVHLQMDDHETVDMVVLEKRAGRTIWGIPISNAAGKIEYLTMGNRKGDMNLITSTDRIGRVEYLYPIRDDTGRSHNLHLKTTGGRLSLVESNYHDGQHSTGFVGYDETGEYIVPIHFEENHRLVIDPYAHNLSYAVDVHPAYDIISEVFYYKK